MRFFAAGRAAVHTANWASLLFSSTPISGAFSKLPVRIYFIVVSLLVLYQVFGPSGTLSFMLSRNSFTATHFRLRVWKVREADASVLDPAGLGTKWGLAALALTRDGCALDVDLKSSTQEARSGLLYLSFDKQVTANGFSFRTLPSVDSQKLDAVGFELAYCQNLGESASVAPVLLPWQCPDNKWVVVGSSDCRLSVYTMSCYPVPNWIFNTSLSRDYVHTFDLSGPWYHGLCNVLRHLLIIAGFIGACVWSVLGNLQHARVHFGIVTFALNGMVNGVLLGCAHLVNGAHPAIGWMPLIAGVAYIYLGCVIVWQEKFAFKVMGYIWPPMVILTVLDAVLVYGGKDYFLMTALRLAHMEVIWICLLWTTVTIYCTWIYRQAWQDVLPAMRAYEQVWRRILEDAARVEELTLLALLAASIEVLWR